MSEFKTPGGKKYNWMMRSVPGMSWAHAPGKWPWDKPPKMVDMTEVLDLLERVMGEEKVIDGVQKSLAAGAPPLVVGKYIAKLGVMNGLWNPDIAEPLGEALSIPIYAIGEASDIEMESSVAEPSLEADIAVVRSKQAKSEAKEAAEKDRESMLKDVLPEVSEPEKKEVRGLMEMPMKGMLATEPEEGTEEENI